MGIFEESYGLKKVKSLFAKQAIEPFTFQIKTWKKISSAYSGIVVAPTGFGKTYSVFLGVIIDFLNSPSSYKSGLKIIWITPIRSLAKDLAKGMQDAINQIGLDWTVEVRNGDTDIKIKQRQNKNMPDVLLLTPESLHLLLAQKTRDKNFSTLKVVVVDEWHELLATKRGVLIELALSFLVYNYSQILIWGITATIGNINQALDVLIPYKFKKVKIIAKEKRRIKIEAVYPLEAETLPWAGHLGGRLVNQIIPIILKSKSTIIFTNTRSQSEYWYQLLLDTHPDFSGQIALHHSSIDSKIRSWIEDSLSEGRLKVVVSTSSLDLGVDFKPVDTVIQIGSSKSIARFMQRAGRSGHSPFEISIIYFVPTNLLELIEVSALKHALKIGLTEDRDPLVMSFDVLIQFLVTIALGGGFYKDDIFNVIINTYSFQWLTAKEWEWCILFTTTGGKIGKNYPEYHKIIKQDDGRYVVTSRKIGMLHRMNIGVISSDAMLNVKFLSGGYVGMVEEYFISKLKQGDKFILAGYVLEFVRIKDMTVYVRLSKGVATAPSWLGGRLSLSSNLGSLLRTKVAELKNPSIKDKELSFLRSLVELQMQKSHIPLEDEFLVEAINTKEGFHLFMYPFEGRLIHEVMASVVAYRISQLYPISFSMSMNDYGFELFSDKVIFLSNEQLSNIFRVENLINDLIDSINATEMAMRKFRDIAVISGYIIQNRYTKKLNNRSLQASSGTIFKTLEDYDKENLLLRQAYTEVFNLQLKEHRLIEVFRRIELSKLIFKNINSFTPFSFPIKVDSLRQSLSSEDLLTRIQRLQNQHKRI